MCPLISPENLLGDGDQLFHDAASIESKRKKMYLSKKRSKRRPAEPMAGDDDATIPAPWQLEAPWDPDPSLQVEVDIPIGEWKTDLKSTMNWVYMTDVILELAKNDMFMVHVLDHKCHMNVICD